MRKILWVILPILFCSCSQQNNTEESNTSTNTTPSNITLKAVNKFSDDSLRIIYTLQDQRDSSALIELLSNTNATYREAAAKAFGSFQAQEALAPLIELLNDRDEKVRNASAYAIGQMQLKGNTKALINAINTETSNQVKTTLLEALGKCGTPEAVKFLATYYGEPILEYGVALGLFRAFINKQSSEAGLARIIQLLNPKQLDKTRVIASTYLARNRAQNIRPFITAISLTLRNDNNPHVRMNCARALSQVSKQQASNDLIKAIENDENHLVKVNAIRALGRFEGNEFNQKIIPFLTNKNNQIAITASEYIKSHSTKKDYKKLKKILENTLHWQVRANLLEAMASSKSKTSKLIIKQLQESNNIYEQGALLKALATNIENYDFIKQRLFHTDNAVIKSYAIEALNGIRLNPDFSSLKKEHEHIEQEFVDIIKFCFKDKDVGLIYHASQLLRNPNLDFKAQISSFDFMLSALKNLQLPRDIEAYEELSKTLEHLGVAFEKVEVKAEPHPIDWNYAASITPNQALKVVTSKGDIILELMVEEVPGTVAEICKLAENGFFDGKAFHRVIPNFVAQGGCPRGDGFGGLPYTLRSELPQLYYNAGYVGMARTANKNTESCQWFITHSPTPHLDGNYTIFAKVTSGMPIVQRLGIGDIIENIELIQTGTNF